MKIRRLFYYCFNKGIMRVIWLSNWKEKLSRISLAMKPSCPALYQHCPEGVHINRTQQSDEI